MKELPIIFQTPMVQAILDGTKTQTRRIIKGRSGNPALYVEQGHNFCLDVNGWGLFIKSGPNESFLIENYIDCPYGKPGDLLYVRETTMIKEHWLQSGERQLVLKWKDNRVNALDKNDQFMSQENWYTLGGDFDTKWTPSIHVPKKYARIWLRVKRVWVERVNDISAKDSVAEGIKFSHSTYQNGDDKTPDLKTIEMWYHNYTGEFALEAKESFQSLWNSINLKRDGGKYSWKSNPWVWCIEFDVVSTTGRSSVNL